MRAFSCFFASAVEVGSNCHAARSCCRWSDGKLLGDSPHLALVLRDDFAQPAPAPTEAVIALGKSMAAPLQTLVANDLQLGPDQPVPATATLNELFARKGAAALSHVVGCIAKEFGATPANAADMTLADLAKVIGSARRRQWVGCAMGLGRCGSAIRAFLQDLEGAAEHALNGTLDPRGILGVPPSLEDCDRLLRKAR